MGGIISRERSLFTSNNDWGRTNIPRNIDWRIYYFEGAIINCYTGHDLSKRIQLISMKYEALFGYYKSIW